MTVDSRHGRGGRGLEPKQALPAGQRGGPEHPDHPHDDHHTHDGQCLQHQRTGLPVGQAVENGPELQATRRKDSPVSRKTIRSQISRCCSRAPAVSDAEPKRPK